MTLPPSSLSILPDLPYDIHIRDMHYGDLKAVGNLDRLSFSMPWPEDSFRSELRNPSSLCRVADASFPDGTKQIVAAMVTWIIVDEAHISTLAVHPFLRRRGIGKRLMMDTLEICFQKGVTSVTLEVWAGNISAQGLYQKLGFEIVAIQHGYYSDNHEDACIMTLKNLAALFPMENSSTQETGKTI